jgi:hypothetical protein
MAGEAVTGMAALFVHVERIGMRMHDHPVLLEEDNRVLGRLTVEMDFDVYEFHMRIVSEHFE